MSYEIEFKTVDLIMASRAETRGVDAFTLALIKCERQVRKIFTNLVFQFPCFTVNDIEALRLALGNNTNVYFEGFIQGFDALYCRSIRELLGEDYERLVTRMGDAIGHRNKIFHGQLTKQGLTREDLLGYVADIRKWCENLSRAMSQETGYDGFSRDSFQKSTNTEIWRSYRVQFNGIDCYTSFVKGEMERNPKKRKQKNTTP